MMVIFMWQLDWATGYPDIWLNIILSMSGRVFLGEINIWISRLNKADCPLQHGWASSVLLRPELNKRLNKKEFFLSACLWAGTPVCLQTQTWIGTSTISSPRWQTLDSDRNHTIGSPGSLACPLQMVDNQSPYLCEPIPHSLISFFRHISILLALLLWRSQPNTQGLLSPLADGVSVPGGSRRGTDSGPRDRKEETVGHHPSWPILPLAQLGAHASGRWQLHPQGSNHHRSQI